MSCPVIFNSNTIELTMHTSYYCLELTLCYLLQITLKATRLLSSAISTYLTTPNAGRNIQQQKLGTTVLIDRNYYLC